jgi:hypothetical protein
LIQVEMQTFISGPGVKLVEFGPPSVATLTDNDDWVSVVHLGLNENSLASRLSTSVRSKDNQKANKSDEKSPSLSIIDQWLDVLKMDNRKKLEPVVVTAVYKYRHCFLPPTVFLESEASCTIALAPENVAGTSVEAARQGKAREEVDPSSPQLDPRSKTTDDLLRFDFMASSIIQVLDPGRENLLLQYPRRFEPLFLPTIRPVDALRFLKDFRDIHGFSQDPIVMFDLASLESHYRRARRTEALNEKPANRGSSFKQRAKGVVSKFSPTKLVKKSARAPEPPVPERPVTPLRINTEVYTETVRYRAGSDGKSCIVEEEESDMYGEATDHLMGEAHNG